MRKSMLLFFLIVFLSSCSFVNDDVLDSNVNFDIKDAKKLLKISDNFANKLYKITSDEEFKNIKPPDTIADFGVLATFNINDEYIIITYSYGNYPWPEAGYLVSKNTGKGYSLENIGFPHKAYEGQRVIQYYDNSIYYITYDRNGIFYPSGMPMRIAKISLADPNNLAAQYLTTDIETVSNFVVGKNHHLIYYGRNAINFSPLSRLRLNSGTLINLPVITDCFFDDFDNNIYFYSNRYQKIIVDDFNNVSYVNFISGGNISSDIFIKIDQSSIYKVQTNLRSMSKVYSLLYNNNDTAIVYDFSSKISDVKNVFHSDDFIYFSGYNSSHNSVIFQFNPRTDTYIEKLNTLDYDIYCLSVDVDENITFSAIRMSDGRKVIGNLRSDGVIEIIDSGINSMVLLIEEL